MASPDPRNDVSRPSVVSGKSGNKRGSPQRGQHDDNDIADVPGGNEEYGSEYYDDEEDHDDPTEPQQQPQNR